MHHSISESHHIHFCLLYSGSEDDATTKRKKKSADAQSASLKDELRSLLSQPLVARGVVKNYITSGAQDLVQDLLDGESEFIPVNPSNKTVLTTIFRHKWTIGLQEGRHEDRLASRKAAQEKD